MGRVHRSRSCLVCESGVGALSETRRLAPAANRTSCHCHCPPCVCAVSIHAPPPHDALPPTPDSTPQARSDSSSAASPQPLTSITRTCHPGSLPASARPVRAVTRRPFRWDACRPARASLRSTSRRSAAAPGRARRA
eukprot:scaffold5086_cov118-Isochrysis_galbana.AAC.2